MAGVVGAVAHQNQILIPAEAGIPNQRRGEGAANVAVGDQPPPGFANDDIEFWNQPAGIEGADNKIPLSLRMIFSLPTKVTF